MNSATRKPNRLKKYNYSQSGYYFITICTFNRKNLFSQIECSSVGQGFTPAEITLSAIGQIAERQLYNIEKRYKNIKIDRFVIMPNHIHLILIIENNNKGL